MSYSSSEPVTVMIIDRVKPDKTEHYEQWLSGIHGDMRLFDGFQSVDIVRPASQANPEYMVLLKFENSELLRSWRNSENARQWLSQLPEFLRGDAHREEASGMEIWFSRPDVLPEHSPPYWKSVVVGVISVYPLLLLLIVTLHPFTAKLPLLIGVLINVTVLSVLLTYPVMPIVTKVLKGWLYPDGRHQPSAK